MSAPYPVVLSDWNLQMCKTEIHLSPRELDVLRLAGAGYTAYQTARILHCSFYTVKTHRRRAFEKIGAFSLVHALVLAHQLGLLDVASIEPIRVPLMVD